jgi:hypothetical protein
MFKKALVLSFVCLFSTLGIAFWNHVHLRIQDLDAYSTFKIEHPGKYAPHVLESHPGIQQRKMIQKDFWMPPRGWSQNKDRMHMRATATDSEIMLSKRKRKFEAIEVLHNLECNLDGRQLVALQGTYCYPSHYIALEQLSYRDGRMRLDADRGRLQQAVLHCEGTVRLKHDQEYALCDQLVYFPSTRSAILSAEGDKRVLVWSRDSMRLSAPEVRMQFDPEPKIQGIGDVHFTFDLEEQELIDTLFSKYL